LRDCFCDSIPRIENETDVLILQHARERSHPFNSARIAHQALVKSKVVWGYTDDFSSREIPLRTGAALLYPAPDAPLLAEVPADERPRQLVIVDGTWHQGKTLVRDLEVLNPLPRYRLATDESGRRRIRREPHPGGMSTLDAVVAALRILEPRTGGFGQLVRAFDAVVKRQLDHPRAKQQWRHKKKKNKFNCIPEQIVHHFGNVVVAYGEAEPCRVGDKRPRGPVYWTATRVGSGEHIECAIETSAKLEDDFLRHIELTRADFEHALSLAEFRSAWCRFLQPHDVVAVYYPGTARLLRNAGVDSGKCLVLKSIHANVDRQHFDYLEHLISAKGITAEETQHRGRAGRRLASTLALSRYLHRLGHDPSRSAAGGVTFVSHTTKN
jgi:DTW domain-containing protein YfiP